MKNGTIPLNWILILVKYAQRPYCNLKASLSKFKYFYSSSNTFMFFDYFSIRLFLFEIKHFYSVSNIIMPFSNLSFECKYFYAL